MKEQPIHNASINPRLERLLLLVTALLCGGLIMVIEVLGSRVIGPFFGVSLFVWSALIAVAMIALACGYAIGGRLADRFPQADTLYGLIATAGVLVVLIPLIKGPVLAACVPLGLRLGAFVGSLVLFGPSLLLLGCVSPYLVRIAAREVESLGRTVGSLYALSTLGSVIGTVSTGFLLVIYLGVNEVFFLVGFLLTGLATFYFVLFRRWFATAALLLVPLAAMLLQGARPTSLVLPSGTVATVIDQVESRYGNIKIVDYTYGPRHNREMILDGAVQSGIDMRNGQSVYPYYYLLGIVPTAVRPQGTDCLVIGAGGGTVPLWYEDRGVRTDVVDIDPEIIRLARQYFGFAVSGEVTIEDARYFLANGSKRYDYLIMDVFNGEAAPPHIISSEALAVLKKRLKPGGVLAINYHGRLDGDTLMTASVVKTLKGTFDQVDLYPAFDATATPAIGNVCVVAYDGAAVDLPHDLAVRFPIHPSARPVVAQALRARFELPVDAPAITLNDNYNPIDCYDFEVREYTRRAILESTPLEILAN